MSNSRQHLLALIGSPFSQQGKEREWNLTWVFLTAEFFMSCSSATVTFSRNEYLVSLTYVVGTVITSKAVSINQNTSNKMCNNNSNVAKKKHVWLYVIILLISTLPWNNCAHMCACCITKHKTRRHENVWERDNSFTAFTKTKEGQKPVRNY